MTTNQLETPFAYDELFYSKTDKRGVIVAGNSVFQRVSGYDWDELSGRPHNIIRHSDMPQGVFYLLWDSLKANQPLGAFVKNRSKDGRHYWVYALALPVDDGYISVRLKAGGGLRRLVENKYEDLRSVEISKKISPKDSCAHLLKVLSELGFPSYQSFMSKALVDQIENRAKEISQQVSPVISSMNEVLKISLSVISATRNILNAFNKSRFVPMNLEVQAARMGKEGEQIAVVASQYQNMIVDVNREVDLFERMSEDVSKQIETSQFYIGASELLWTIDEFLMNEKNGESDSNGPSGNVEIKKMAEDYLSRARQSILTIKTVVSDFVRICASLRSLGAGLEIVRLTGRIESARLSSGSEIQPLLADLKTFQTSLAEGLAEILKSNSSLSQIASEILTQMKA